MAYRCFGKKSTTRTGAGANCNPEDSDKKNLSQQLHKPIIRKLVKRKVYSSFNDNIWGADVTDMPLDFNYYEFAFGFYQVLIFFLINVHGLFL